ncbi:unnamed protein product, partial [Hapterophycus canaliculatus]
ALLGRGVGGRARDEVRGGGWCFSGCWKEKPSLAAALTEHVSLCFLFVEGPRNCWGRLRGCLFWRPVFIFLCSSVFGDACSGGVGMVDCLTWSLECVCVWKIWRE